MPKLLKAETRDRNRSHEAANVIREEAALGHKSTRGSTHLHRLQLIAAHGDHLRGSIIEAQTEAADIGFSDFTFN